MADFKIAYRLTAGNEGGYANDPNDSGGETYCGIARKSHPNWIGWTIIDTIKSHRTIRTGERIDNPLLDGYVVDFYYQEFWRKIGGDELQDQDLANQVYDMAVTSGVSVALNLLKQS